MNLCVKRLNIAFIPKKKREEFVILAQQYQLIHSYCLGKNSIPHVTLCHFYLNENKVPDFWKEVCSKIDIPKIKLTFNKISNISFDGLVYWVSLIPEQNSYLEDIHHMISREVESLRKDKYDPHLTLFNYLKFESEPDFQGLLISNFLFEDEFYLAIGESDNFGQLIRIIAFAE